MLLSIGFWLGIAITTNSRCAGASRQLNAASEDPPSWTISVSDNWSAWTIAVFPEVKFLITMAAVSVGVPVLSRIQTFVKTMSATAVMVATLTKTATFPKTLAATAIGVATLNRKQFITMAATAVGVAALSLARLTALMMVATAVGAATLIHVATFAQTIVAVSVGIATQAVLFIAGAADNMLYWSGAKRRRTG